MDYTLLTDDILAKLLKADDKEAFKHLYKRYWQQVFSSAYYRLNNKEIAQELTQNLFLRIWENRRQSVIQSIQHYLITAVKNSVINYIESALVQKKYQQHFFNKDHQSASADERTYYNELSVALEKAIRMLPEKTRNVFQQSRFENRSVREIAGNLRISEKAVEYHITQSLKILRLQLKEYLITPCLTTIILFA
jgi:RNA polymerase sigma-70 factor (family 1)